jgi:aconitase A
VTLQVTSSGADDTLTDNTRSIELVVRLDGPMELATYREGGIMPAVLRRMAKQ